MAHSRKDRAVFNKLGDSNDPLLDEMLQDGIFLAEGNARRLNDAMNLCKDPKRRERLLQLRNTHQSIYHMLKAQKEA